MIDFNNYNSNTVNSEPISEQPTINDPFEGVFSEPRQQMDVNTDQNQKSFFDSAQVLTDRTERAEQIINFATDGIAQLMALISGEDAENYIPKKSAKNLLSESLAPLLPEYSNTQLPPWLVFAVVFILSYTIPTISAFKRDLALKEQKKALNETNSAFIESSETL